MADNRAATDSGVWDSKPGHLGMQRYFEGSLTLIAMDRAGRSGDHSGASASTQRSCRRVRRSAPRAGEVPMAPHSRRAVGLRPPSSDRRPKDFSSAQLRALKREPAQSPLHRVPLSADRKEPARGGATNPRHLRTRRLALLDRAHGEEPFHGPRQRKFCQLPPPIASRLT